MTAKKKIDYAQLKANRALAKDIVGYDYHTSIIGGKTKIEILDMILDALDLTDLVTAKEITLEFKKREVQYQMPYGLKAKGSTK